MGVQKNNLKNYSKYFLYNIFTSMSLILPIRVSYMLIYFVSESQISLLKVIFSLTVFLLEIPSGVLSDKFGRKKTVVAGTFFFSIHALSYIVLQNFVGFFISQILLGIANSLISGADSSYLHSYVKTFDAGRSYTNVLGKLRAFSRPFSLLFSVISSFLFSRNIYLNFIITALFGIFAMVSFISLPSEDSLSKYNECAKAQENLSLPNIFVAGLKYFLQNKIIFFKTILFSLLSGLLIVNFEYYQPLFKDANIPIEFFGLVYASFSFLGILGDLSAKRISERISYYSIIMFGFLLMAGSFIAITSNIVLLVMMSVIVQQLIFAVASIIYETDLLDEAEKNVPLVKTTIISFAYTLSAISKIVLMLVFSLLLRAVNLKIGYLVLSVFCVFISLIILHEKNR